VACGASKGEDARISSTGGAEGLTCGTAINKSGSRGEV